MLMNYIEYITVRLMKSFFVCIMLQDDSRRRNDLSEQYVIREFFQVKGEERVENKKAGAGKRRISGSGYKKWSGR
jgi:hypothetical protein